MSRLAWLSDSFSSQSLLEFPLYFFPDGTGPEGGNERSVVILGGAGVASVNVSV